MTRDGESRRRAGALLACLILGAACGSDIRQAERALHAGDSKGAFRAAARGLGDPERPEEQRKRLFSLMMAAAQRVLSAPDDTDVAAALQLYEAMPADSAERQRAAERFLRVMARAGRPATELDAALGTLEPDMGEAAEVRSNLRSLAVALADQPGGLWAARVVVARWPEDPERWAELGRALALQGQAAEATAAFHEAAARLHQRCADLPERMRHYDRVRRDSAYGQLEVQRCRGFAALAARILAAAQARPSAEAVPSRLLALAGSATAPCPASAPPAVPGRVDGVMLMSPAPSRWWVDGRRMTAPSAALPAGPHEVVWEDGPVCRHAAVRLADGEAVALRTVQDVGVVP